MAAHMRLIMWLAVGAISICLFAIYQQYRTVTFPAPAEDDCPFYHGTFSLSAVERRPDGWVDCTYRGAF